MVLGGKEMDCYFWSQVFSYLGVKFMQTDRNTASMVKYMHNTWLATKVAFFHEIFSKLDTTREEELEQFRNLTLNASKDWTLLLY